MSQNKKEGHVFDEDNLKTLIDDLEFKIANHIAIIQDLCCKLRCLKQEKKKRDEAWRFKNPKSYNYAKKHPLDGEVCKIRSLERLETFKGITKENRSTIVETKKPEERICMQFRLTLINKGSPNETEAKGKEKVTVEACE